MAGKKFSVYSPVSVGIAETCSLVPGATGVAYYLFSSLPKNFCFFIFLFLNLSANGFLRALPTSEKFCRLLRSFSAIRSSTSETVCLGSVMRF